MLSGRRPNFLIINIKELVNVADIILKASNSMRYDARGIGVDLRQPRDHHL